MVKEFVAVDIETTGFHEVYDGIISIGLVHIRDGEVIDEYYSLINSSREITPQVTSLTGITNKMIASAPSYESVLNDVLEFIGYLPIVAHNASFDYRFIKQKCKVKLGVEITNKKICTMQYARKGLPQLPNHKLNTVARHFNIPNISHHNALNDARVCADICLCMIGEKPVATLPDSPIRKLSNLMNKFFD